MIIIIGSLILIVLSKYKINKKKGKLNILIKLNIDLKFDSHHLIHITYINLCFKLNRNHSLHPFHPPSLFSNQKGKLEASLI